MFMQCLYLKKSPVPLSDCSWHLEVLSSRHALTWLVVQGIVPNLAKVAPAAGISWFVFEEVKLLLGVDPHS